MIRRDSMMLPLEAVPEAAPDKGLLRSLYERSSQAVVVGIAAVSIVVGGALSTEGQKSASPEPTKLVGEVPDALTVWESQYPAKRSLPKERIVIDERSDTSVAIYRHEGLTELSFARPTTETVRGVIEAQSIAEIDQHAAPFFETLGLNLVLTDADAHPTNGHNFTQLTDADLPQAKDAVLHALNEISMTPIEVVQFASIADVVFARDIHWQNAENQESHALGMAYLGAGPGILAINVMNVDYSGNRDTWNHELGHHVIHWLEQMNPDFKRTFMAQNPEWFRYAPYAKAGDSAEVTEMRRRAVAEYVTQGDYGTTSYDDDAANVYMGVYFDEMTPDPNDASFSKPLGRKRVWVLEELDRRVPGTKRFFVGVASTGQYKYQGIPTTPEHLATGDQFFDN